MASVNRAIIPFAAAAVLAVGLAAAPSPSPTPTAIVPAPSPTATPTEIPGVDTLFPGGSHRGGPHASPSPPIPQRVGIEGVWELAIQRGADTTYTHLQLRQQQNALTGIYIDASNKHVPAIGIVDGTSVRIVVTYPDGSTVVLQGTLDGTSDMIGLMTTATGQVPFSGDYRPKESFFDNVNEQPGGLSNPFPSPPPK
jgi:cytochrome c5